MREEEEEEEAEEEVEEEEKEEKEGEEHWFPYQPSTKFFTAVGGNRGVSYHLK